MVQCSFTYTKNAIGKLNSLYLVLKFQSSKLEQLFVIQDAQTYTTSVMVAPNRHLVAYSKPCSKWMEQALIYVLNYCKNIKTCLCGGRLSLERGLSGSITVARAVHGCRFHMISIRVFHLV